MVDELPGMDGRTRCAHPPEPSSRPARSRRLSSSPGVVGTTATRTRRPADPAVSCSSSPSRLRAPAPSRTPPPPPPRPRPRHPNAATDAHRRRLRPAGRPQALGLDAGPLRRRPLRRELRRREADRPPHRGPGQSPCVRAGHRRLAGLGPELSAGSHLGRAARGHTGHEPRVQRWPGDRPPVGPSGGYRRPRRQPRGAPRPLRLRKPAEAARRVQGGTGHPRAGLVRVPPQRGRRRDPGDHGDHQHHDHQHRRQHLDRATDRRRRPPPRPRRTAAGRLDTVPGPRGFLLGRPPEGGRHLAGRVGLRLRDADRDRDTGETESAPGDPADRAPVEPSDCATATTTAPLTTDPGSTLTPLDESTTPESGTETGTITPDQSTPEIPSAPEDFSTPEEPSTPDEPSSPWTRPHRPRKSAPTRSRKARTCQTAAV